MVRTYNLTDNGEVSHDDLAEIPSSLATEYRRTSLREGDVVLSVVGSMGRSAVASAREHGFNLNRPLARLRVCPGVPPRLIWHWTRTTGFRELAALATGGGTAQPTLNLGDLENFMVGLPQDRRAWPEILSLLDAKYHVIDQTSSVVMRQINLLREHRETIITDAVTGQLDISRSDAAVPV
ncbi:MAG: restriction endonuclease subunit S domain-containing protein [Acidimicrobiales bacterium]